MQYFLFDMDNCLKCGSEFENVDTHFECLKCPNRSDSDNWYYMCRGCFIRGEEFWETSKNKKGYHCSKCEKYFCEYCTQQYDKQNCVNYQCNICTYDENLLL